MATGNEYSFKYTRTDSNKIDFVVQPLTVDGYTYPSTIDDGNGGTTTPAPRSGATVATTSLVFIGKGRPDYGEVIQQNFLYLLENFAHENAPASPLLGQQWYDSTNEAMKVWNGTVWEHVADDYVLKAGDTMTENLIVTDGTDSVTLMKTGYVRVTKDPANPLDLATKQYVDGLVGGGTAQFVDVAGDTMTGDLIMDGANIQFTNGALGLQSTTPTANNHLTNKQYVDDQINNIVASGGTQFVDRAELQANGNLELFYVGNASSTPDVTVDASAAGGGVGGKTAPYINVEDFEDSRGNLVTGATVQDIIETFAIRKLDSDNPAIASKEFVRKEIRDAFGGIQRTFRTVASGEDASGFSVTVPEYTIGANQVWVFADNGSKLRYTSPAYQDLLLNDIDSTTSLYPTNLFTSVSDGTAYDINVAIDGGGATDVTVTPVFEGPASATTQNFIILDTDDVAESIFVSGDQRNIFLPGVAVTISNSDATNGTFDVVQSVFDPVEDETEVTLAGNLTAVTTNHGDAEIGLPDRYTISDLVTDINTGLTNASVAATAVFDEGSENIRFVSNTAGATSDIVVVDDNIAANGTPLFANLPAFINTTRYDVTFYQPDGDEPSGTKYAYIAIDGDHTSTFNSAVDFIIRDSGDEVESNDGEYTAIDIGGGTYSIFETGVTKIYIQALQPVGSPATYPDARLIVTTPAGLEGYIALPQAITLGTTVDGYDGHFTEDGTYNQQSTTISVGASVTTLGDVLEIMVF